MRNNTVIERFRFLICGIPVLCAFLFLCACRGDKDKANTEKPQPGADALAIDWRSVGFAASDEVEDAPELWISEYDLWEYDEVQTDPEKESRRDLTGLITPHICGGVLYRVATVTPQDGDLSEARWVLESYDAATGGKAQRPFTRADLGVGEETGALIGMGVVAPGSFVFRYVGYEQTEDGIRITGNRLVYTDLQEDAAAVDLWERYLEDKVEKDDSVESVTLLYAQAECVCDGKGNTYQTAGQEKYGPTELFVYGREGETVLSYQAKEQETVGPFLRTEDGEILCTAYDWEKKRYIFLWADTEQRELRRVGELPSASNDIARFYGMQGNDVYYADRAGKTVQWNVETGKRKVVFSPQDNGITNGEYMRLGFSQEGGPFLWMTTDYPKVRNFVAGLSGKEITGEDHVRVADIALDEDHRDGRWQVKYCTTLSSQCIPGRIFSYEKDAANPEAQRDRVFAQLVAGEGPDILYVSRTDMYMLEEKDLLADLREILPADALDAVLPGALELGTVGGRLVGITPSVSVDTIAVSRDVWEEDSWRLEEFLGLLGEGRLKPWWKYLYDRSWQGLPVLQILEHLCADSFLIDWEERECYFEDDRVIRLLRAGQEVSYATEEQPEFAPILHGGNRIAEVGVRSGLGLSQFDMLLEAENGYCVGWPTEGGCGNYLEADGFIVVNAAAANPEDVRIFLECLLSDRIQYTPSLENHVQITRLSEERIVWDGKLLYPGWSDNFELGVFEDGTDSVQRAAAFLEGCKASPVLDEKIRNILYEELDAMYAGDQTPERTAEILNNRIRLYLKETG